MMKMDSKGSSKYGASKLQTPFGSAMVKHTGDKGKGGKYKGSMKKGMSKGSMSKGYK